MTRMRSYAAGCAAVVLLAGAGAVQRAPATIDVTVTEGKSMSVAVSPDGRSPLIDLQGRLWILPATGGALAVSVGRPILPSRWQGLEREDAMSLIREAVREQLAVAERIRKWLSGDPGA